MTSICRYGFKRAMLAAAVAAGMGSMSSAYAIAIDTGNPDWGIRWDNTVRYNLGFRAESPDSGLSNSASYDESNSKFDKGDIVTNRIDILSELEVVYQRSHGFRVSAAGWYDDAYRDTDVETNGTVHYGGGVWAPSVPSYSGGKYSGHTKRWHHGPSGEILDAFVFTNFDVSEVPVGVRAGRHNIFWGESVFFAGHGVANQQGPIDGRKAVSSPGIEARELYLPLNQVSAQASLTPDLSIAGQYFLEWEPTRAPEGGTFLASGDVALAGPDQLPVPTPFGIVPLPIGDAVKPDDRGNWGVSARWLTDIGDIGFYYREYDEYSPWSLAVQNGTARYVYAEDNKLIGLSWAGTHWGTSIGAELSYRHDSALASTGLDANRDGARGDTLHMVVNATKGLAPNGIWDTGIILGEIAFAHLLDVNSNPQLFNGEGYGCPDGRDKDWGCATKNYIAAAVNFQPEWVNVADNLNLVGVFSLNMGLYGNAAAGGGNGEGGYTAKAGVKGVYARNFQLELAYNAYGGKTHSQDFPEGRAVIGVGSQGSMDDRDWVSLTASYAF